MATDTNTSPRWMRDMNRFLPLRSQFVLWGNVRDRFPLQDSRGKLQPMPLPEYLAENFHIQGVPHALSFVPGEGLRVVRRREMLLATETEFYKRHFDLDFGASDVMAMSSDRFIEIVERLAWHREEPVALIADFASRLIVRADGLSEAEHSRFTKALVLSQRALQVRSAGENPVPRYNPVVWLADQESDLPDWLILGNPRVRSIPIPEPDPAARRMIASALCRSLADYSEERAEELCATFVDATDGLKFEDMLGIVQLCRTEGLGFGELSEGARRYKLGVTEDPWKQIDRKRIKEADASVRRRIMGQERAVVGMLDVVKRAVMGLSGGGKKSRRPRGVAFLAGPTGTGKTELAKTVTELLFGDEQAYIRFDMSEFSAEHSDQRLLGAPPGYVGHDAGGELTNAIRERPFSVVLFDEIEKAHPRILDKFLQVLDDGVLTSGRGERVYFSEAFIIFTSNLGISRMDSTGVRQPNVLASDSYEVLAGKIRSEIENYFKLELGRPEILNRLGESFLIFDFIRPDVAVRIFDGMVGRVLADMGDACGVGLTLVDAAWEKLRALCTDDLSNGGRGIRNQIEANLVNPLARALFDGGFEAGSSAEIIDVLSPPGIELRPC